MNGDKMKVVILAGGFGTRISEHTGMMPKPMINVCGRPLIWHIMSQYAKYGYKDFYIALGYKSEKVKEYFLNYRELNADFTVDLSNGNIDMRKSATVDWRVTLVDTGLNTMTGGRVRRMREAIGNEPFLLTYGDGLANINIDDLVKFHKQHGKKVTVTAVRPTARFGELELDDSKVEKFSEKPRMHKGWINGGYFVFEPDFIDYIEGDMTMLEREPLEHIANVGELMAYKHEDYWHCVDTKRDLEIVESQWIKYANYE